MAAGAEHHQVIDSLSMNNASTTDRSPLIGLSVTISLILTKFNLNLLPLIIDGVVQLRVEIKISLSI